MKSLFTYWLYSFTVIKSGWDFKGNNRGVFWRGSKHLCWAWPYCQCKSFPAVDKAFGWSKNSWKNCSWWWTQWAVPVSNLNVLLVSYPLKLARELPKVCRIFWWWQFILYIRRRTLCMDSQPAPSWVLVDINHH